MKPTRSLRFHASTCLFNMARISRIAGGSCGLSCCACTEVVAVMASAAMMGRGLMLDAIGPFLLALIFDGLVSNHRLNERTGFYPELVRRAILAGLAPDGRGREPKGGGGARGAQ